MAVYGRFIVSVKEENLFSYALILISINFYKTVPKSLKCQLENKFL